MIKKTFKYACATILCLVIVTVSWALLYRKYLQHKVFEERAITSPNGIESLEAVRIGGIDQWIEVRGQNAKNPILLFIHGAPGISTDARTPRTAATSYFAPTNRLELGVTFG